MKQGVWLNFDLGVRGNYEQLYAWLDNHKAKECGESAAYFRYDYEGDLVTQLKGELETILGKDQRARVYVVYRVDGPDQEKKIKGHFLLGGRKSPPWAGFGSGDKQEIDQ
jgi:hypothetical protein